MINKNSKYWKEAKTHDKLRQQKGFKPMSDSDLILTALHFERCDNEAMEAIAFDKKRQMGEKERPNIFISDCGNYIALRIPTQPEGINFDVWRHDGSEYWEGTRYIPVPSGKKDCYNPRTVYTEEFTHPQKIVGSWTNLGHENRKGEWIEAFELTLDNLETGKGFFVKFHTPLLSLAPQFKKRRQTNERSICRFLDYWFLRGNGIDDKTALRILAIAYSAKEQLEEGEKVSSADQTWRQEPVPSEEDVRAEIGEDEAADKRDANKQEEDFYNDFHQTGGGGERQ